MTPFRVGDKVRVISYNATGTIIEIDIVKKTATVNMDDVEGMAKKLLPKERFRNFQKQMDTTDKDPQCHIYTEFKDLQLIVTPQADWKEIWDSNE